MIASAKNPTTDAFPRGCRYIRDECSTHPSFPVLLRLVSTMCRVFKYLGPLSTYANTVQVYETLDFFVCEY